jgi:hypothetical protein
MRRDVKEILGLLMRALSGDEVPLGEIEAATFEASGDLEWALNDAYIKLLEFAHDHGARLNDPQLDREMRAGLEECLERIGRLTD